VPNILFILSGSIAAYKACDVISRLVQRGHRVRTVATASALRFVGPATLEGLTGEPVASDLFASGAALDHIEFARWADVTILCPATANTLNRAAAGLADDLAGALLLAHDRSKPLLIAPAMNPTMWVHPATQASVQRLQGWGARFIPVGEGRTACGEMGEGRLAEPESIVSFIESALQRPGRKLKVLITSGATAEPIDGVRVLTNLSTGRTGAMIADYFAAAGHEVTLLRAETATAGASRMRQETFTRFSELDSSLSRLLADSDFDAVIHAAAVSDFSPELLEDENAEPQRDGGKIDSTKPRLLRLRPNPKLVDGLRARSRNSAIQVVAFKLTHHADPAEARLEVDQLFTRAKPDFVVHNDLADRTEGRFPATIHHADGTTTPCPTRTELASALEDVLVKSQRRDTEGAEAGEETTEVGA
jgi:phosphopantothenoylcysteine decarboxylase / phosphopantothenate---cysteine ligase